MTISARFADRQPLLPDDLPPALVRVARTMPVVGALADVVGPGSPRWGIWLPCPGSGRAAAQPAENAA